MFTAPRDSKSRCEPLARRSQIFTVPSSEPEYIHLPSRSKPTAVMLLVCPSKDVMGCGLFVFTSKRRIDGFPAAARDQGEVDEVGSGAWGRLAADCK